MPEYTIKLSLPFEFEINASSEEMAIRLASGIACEEIRSIDTIAFRVDSAKPSKA
jgi:hypothetical protein